MWVTGATGFVGWHLSAALVALRAKVTGISRHASEANLPPGCAGITLDLRSLESLRERYAAQRPEIVFHLASHVTAEQHLDLLVPTFQQNLAATVNLLLVAKEQSCRRLVLVGSSEEPADLNFMPRSPYAAAKAAINAYAKMFQGVYGQSIVTARPFFTYGPRQPLTKLLPYTIRALLRGESPRLTSCRRICDFVYVQDVVNGFLEIGVQSGLEGKRIDIGTGQGSLVRDVIDRVSSLIGGSGRPLYDALPDRIGELPQVADLAATQAVMNWRPQWTLEAGLAQTVDWFRKQG